MSDAVARVRGAGALAWAVVGLAAAVAVVAMLAWSVRVIFPPLLLATVIVILFGPLVGRLQRKGVPRAAGAGLLYLAAGALATLAVAAVAPVVRAQAVELQGQWPQLRATIEQWLHDRADDVRGTPLEFSPDELGETLWGGPSSLGDRLERLWRVGDRLLQALVVLVAGPVVAFYLLVDLPRLRDVGRSMVPPGARREVDVVARRLAAVVGGFVRGQMVIALIVGVLASLGLAALGLPFSLLLGVIAGIGNLAPLVGPIVGGVPAVVVALATRDVTTAVWTVVVMAFVQQAESHLISPLVLQRTAKLHPAAVILALFAGASTAGLLGILVAAPAVAALKVVAGHLWRVHVLGEPVPGLPDPEEAPVDAGGG